MVALAGLVCHIGLHLAGLAGLAGVHPFGQITVRKYKIKTNGPSLAKIRFPFAFAKKNARPSAPRRDRSCRMTVY